MPLSVSWADESKTTISVRIQGEWNLDEYRAMLREIVSLMRSVSHPVYVLTDARESALPPLGIVWHARYAFQWFPNNFAAGVVVTRNTFFIDVVNTARALYVKRPRRLIAVSTPDEGLAAIQRWIAEGR